MRAVPLVGRAVDRERARPTSRLLEVALADRARGGGRLGRTRAARLAVGAHRGRDGVEAQVERDGNRTRLGAAGATRARLDLALHGQSPRLQRLEHLVAHGPDVEHRVDHLPLLFDPAVLAQLAAGEPERHADVHRPLVGTNADAGEQAGVGGLVVRIEVVGLAPGGITFDRMGKIVSGVEDRHRLHHCPSGAVVQRGPVAGRAGESSRRPVAPR